MAENYLEGNCWDNAIMESFYRTLKVELIYQKTYETRLEAQRDIFKYIEIFYNRDSLLQSGGI
jgi:putative transposase